VVPYARLGSAAVGEAIGATGLGRVRFLVDVAVLAGLILPPATWLQLAGWLAGATLLCALGPGRAQSRPAP